MQSGSSPRKKHKSPSIEGSVNSKTTITSSQKEDLPRRKPLIRITPKKEGEFFLPKISVVYSILDDIQPSTSTQLNVTNFEEITTTYEDHDKPKTGLKIKSEIKYYDGSDEDTTDDDNNELIALPPLPRTCRMFLDTNEDPETIEPTVNGGNEEFESTNSSEYEPKGPYNFKWNPFPSDPVTPELRREAFFNKNVGSVHQYNDPYDAFVSIWDKDIMEKIAEETNIYAHQLTEKMIADGTLLPRSRMNDWYDTSVDELYVYFAIIMAMSIVIKAKYEDYWCVQSNIFVTPEFHTNMSERRFILLNKCLHFVNNESFDFHKLTPAKAKVLKIQPVINHLNLKFSTLYNLGQSIALDESLTQWKGALGINQLMRKKKSKVGIQTYEVCDTKTGYLWRFEVHTVSEQQAGPVGSKIPTLVLRLLSGLQFRGHTVWMDNNYNSPDLARTMKSLGFDCVGTLRTNRKNVPTELAHLTKLQQGEVTGCTSGDVDIILWKNQTLVALISTYHGNATCKVAGASRPIVVIDYNINMGGLDKKDRILAGFPVERKRTKVWYKKFFRRLLNSSILNAYILYDHSKNTQGRRIEHREFRERLVLSLLERHVKKQCYVKRPIMKIKPNENRILPPEVLAHFPTYTEVNSSNNRRKRRLCAVCKKKTTTMCPACDVGLCEFTCATKYHSS